MPEYSNVISRNAAEALMPEEVSEAILGNVQTESVALRLMPHVPMSRKQRRIPVIATLPMAYWVHGDTGLKQTSDVSWDNVYLNAEELAVIVPIPEAVLDDTDMDIWGIVRPRLEEAIARKLDAAIYFGTEAPASWPTGIAPAAIAKGLVVDIGENTAAEGGVAQDVLDVFGLVEEAGFSVNGIVAATRTRGLLRRARDTTGQRLADVTPSQIEGISVDYALAGQWPTQGAQLIAGDHSQAMIGVRQDITFKVLDQAVIQDASGAIIYNLPQQDMVALRAVARFAWAVPNVINHEQPDADLRYPFGVLRKP